MADPAGGGRDRAAASSRRGPPPRRALRHRDRTDPRCAILASQIRRSRSAATWTIRIRVRTTTRAAARRYWRSRARYAKLIREGRLARPARSLRFIWPPEIEGTTILLNARPDLAARLAAVVHMDMVGGGPQTKAVFHVTRSPASLPTFIGDVAEAFAEFVNAAVARARQRRVVPYPLVAPEGGKEALLAQIVRLHGRQRPRGLHGRDPSGFRRST